MPWLWFAAPLSFLVVVYVVHLWPTAEEQRMRRALNLWLREMLGSFPGEEDVDPLDSRCVPHLPAAMKSMVDITGGGTRIADIELVEDTAFLSVRAADATSSSNQYSVLFKLTESAPPLECRPLPIVDGRLAENTGIKFRDAAFMDHYLVEGPNSRAVKRWMNRRVREALLLFPDLWLRTKGRTLVLTFHGCADAEMLDELIEVADIVFAEYGDGDEPLFGDPPAAAQPPPMEEPERAQSSSTKQSSTAQQSSAAKSSKPKSSKPKSSKPKSSKPKSSKAAASESKVAARAKLDSDPDALDDDVDAHSDDEPFFEGHDAAPIASLRRRATAGAFDVGLLLLGLVLTVAALGYLPNFHPSVLFNSPDRVVTEAWQGGWTTKGFGMVVFVESYLVGLVVLQAYLAVRYGQSVGKMIVGVRIEPTDGRPRNFLRTVFLRKWVFVLIPLIAAAAQARPFGARAFFNHIPTPITAGVAVAVFVVGAGLWMSNALHAGVHDRLAKTEVVVCAPYQLPAIQLDSLSRDPLLAMRMFRGLVVLIAFCVINLIVFWKTDAWLLQLHVHIDSFLE